ncbi:MAG: tetratricopeptide repeat protein [Oscillatoria princeps RMCB-10]|jgi:tetratricopeptide (TPR) repeat protein|nr:tetratricopeptide repeat protein [Oscillatoria princeps RMCB-10]
MSAIEKIAAAFDRKDYREAAQLVSALLNQSPQNPWGQVYLGRLHEVSGKLEAAESVYRQLLRNALNPKIADQARQGLQRLEATVKQKREKAIAQAKTDPQNAEPGVLIIEPVSAETKAEAAKHFARIMELDPYTARLQIPTRNWRLYRTGTMAELGVYVAELQLAGIPAFCVSLAKSQQIRVFRVSYFQSVSSQATAVCKDESDQSGQINFNWSEITQRVEGLLPIFKKYAEFDILHDQVEYKEQTHDYAHICDLHLPRRRCILRLLDQTYEFQQGVPLTPAQQVPGRGEGVTANTSSFSSNWNSLLDFLNRQLPEVKVWSDFTPFAEAVLNRADLLRPIKPSIDVFRRTESNWDPAFEFYSRLVFLRGGLSGGVRL